MGVIRLNAPTVMSFSHNYRETVRFLARFKAAALGAHQNLRRRPVHLDLVPIKSLSVAAAVVFSAEVDRWREVRGVHLRTRNSKDWNPAVLQLLSSLGTFELLGVRNPAPHHTSLEPGLYRVFPIRSGGKVTTEDVALTLEDVTAAIDAFVGQRSVYEALVEAIKNVVMHAHKPVASGKESLRYPRGPSKWWMTTILDARRNELKFFVYDQGVGIPATLPSSDLWNTIADRFKSLLTLSAHNDAELIRVAVTTRKTSSGNP